MPDPRGPSGPPPQYTVYRSRPKLLGRTDRDERPRVAPSRNGRSDHRGRGIDGRRIAKWVVLAALAWIALSVLVFALSAQINKRSVSGGLDSAGNPLTSANTILVLGSDQRAKGSKEAGASTSGPSRADSILLIRTGGGANARLSVARDTQVAIPGHGVGKVNSAYAYGGAALMVQTLKGYLGIDVNHVIEVNFQAFPGLIDAMGGVTVKTGCVVSKINGGYSNGGVTLRLRPGKHRLTGKQALALARTRKNACNRREDDLTRARRQQQIVSAMRSKVSTPFGLFLIPHGSFYRLPFIAWQAPKTLRSDMGAPTLAGLFGALSIGGTPKTRVLGTESGVVPDGRRRALAQRFVKG